MKTKKFGIAMFVVALVCAMALGGCGATGFHSGSATAINVAENSQSTSALEKEVQSAVALLYAKTAEGNPQFFCTATAFERSGKTYHFITASHCVAEDIGGQVALAPLQWYLSFEGLHGVKIFYPAKLLGVGYRGRGDDFAVLETTLNYKIPIIRMSATDAELGEPVINWAAPLSLGKQLFRGHVTSTYLDRPIVESGLNWTGATLIQMSVAGGSSGSAVVSLWSQSPGARKARTARLVSWRAPNWVAS